MTAIEDLFKELEKLIDDQYLTKRELVKSLKDIYSIYKDKLL